MRRRQQPGDPARRRLERSRFRPSRARGLALAALVTLALLPPPGIAQTGPVRRVPIPDRLLEGKPPSAIRGGELRLVRDEEGAELEIGELTIEGVVPEPIREIGWRLPPEESCAWIAGFERTGTNRLGGGFGVWEREPASAEATLVRENGAAFLRFEYRRPPDTWAGLRVELADEEPSDRLLRWLDASGRQALVLRARGSLRDLDVRLADAERRADDALELGPLDELAAGPAADDGGWREIRIPIDPRRLDPARLARLTFHARSETGRVEIDDLHLCDAGASPPPRRRLQRSASPPRSLWVWSTRRIAGDDEATRRLVSLAREAGIDRLYLQLPGDFLDPSRSFDPAADPVGLRPLLAALTAAGIEPHALDGAPRYALAEHHAAVLGALERVASWNAAGEAESRFAGLHLDIEPYLLEGWSGPERGLIVDQFLELFTRLRASATSADLWLEAAIPFWFDGVPAPVADVDPPHARSLFEGLAERVDAVVIMDYRTGLAGSNGIAALATTELELASARGQRVMIALETGPLPDETRFRFEADRRRGPPTAPGEWVVLVGGDAPHFRLLELPGDAPIADDGAPVWHWPVDRRIELPASRLTFRDGDRGEFLRLLRATENELGRYPAFAGLALHHYETLERLLRGAPHGR